MPGGGCVVRGKEKKGKKIRRRHDFIELAYHVCMRMVNRYGGFVHEKQIINGGYNNWLTVPLEGNLRLFSRLWCASEDRSNGGANTIIYEHDRTLNIWGLKSVKHRRRCHSATVMCNFGVRCLWRWPKWALRVDELSRWRW